MSNIYISRSGTIKYPINNIIKHKIQVINQQKLI